MAWQEAHCSQKSVRRNVLPPRGKWNGVHFMEPCAFEQSFFVRSLTHSVTFGWSKGLIHSIHRPTLYLVKRKESIVGAAKPETGAVFTVFKVNLVSHRDYCLRWGAFPGLASLIKHCGVVCCLILPFIPVCVCIGSTEGPRVCEI